VNGPGMPLAEQLRLLADLHQRTAEQIAVLCLHAIAAHTRRACPQAAAVTFDWSSQGPYLTPTGYLAEDGTAVLVDGEEPDLEPFLAYCASLGEDSQSAWGLYLAGPGGRQVLLLSRLGEAPDLGGAALIAPLPPQVWVMRHTGPHDDEVTLYASEAHAIAGLAGHARAHWDNLTPDDGVPRSAAALDDQAAVDLYFARRAGIETYSLYPSDVEGTDGTDSAAPPP
jgi:hypothetical protein